jgi:hypothetical protein
MTSADGVAQVRDGRLEDFVREAVVLVARESMEAEISAVPMVFSLAATPDVGRDTGTTVSDR